jgi:hypothetical protein
MKRIDMAGTHKFTAKKAAVLAAYPECGTITHAARAAGVSRRIHFKWMKSDPQYHEAFEAARDEFTDRLEAEAVRRAHDGWTEPVFYRGAECGAVRRFDSTMLIFLLKANRPAKYRETIRKEHSGPNGSDITFRVVYDE